MYQSCLISFTYRSRTKSSRAFEYQATGFRASTEPAESNHWWSGANIWFPRLSFFDDAVGIGDADEEFGFAVGRL